MKSLSLLSLTVGAVMCLTSCGSDDAEHDTITVSSPSCFCYVQDLTTGQGTTIPNVSATATFDRSEYKASLRLPYVTTAGNLGYVSGDGLALKIDTSTWEYKVTDATISSGSQTLSNITVHYDQPTTIDGVDCEGMYVSYTVDSQYQVTFIPYTTMCTATTETLNTTDQSTFPTTKTVYTITIEPTTNAATLIVTNAAFASGMPSLGAMTFGGLTATFHNGGYVLSCDELIPSISDTPYPRYKIEDLEATAHLDSQIKLTFRCMSVFKVDAYLTPTYSPM
ncbi:MAG: hypothetical protein LIO90_03250 [Bacteroidales bacterium]|nr:hypothetical protein [Bacteroidales bacterium]